MSKIYPTLPIFAQNLACTWAGYRRSRARYTPHFHRTIEAWERSLSASLDELHEIQWLRLKRLVQHARKNVPYCRDLPAPSEVREPAEAIRNTLAGIPPLEKSTYRERTDDLIARNIPRRRPC